MRVGTDYQALIPERITGEYLISFSLLFAPILSPKHFESVNLKLFDVQFWFRTGKILADVAFPGGRILSGYAEIC